MDASNGGTKDLMNVLIYVVFAMVIIPIINSQVVSLEGDSGNYSASELLLMGIITTFIILGVVYAIVKTIL